MYLVNPISITPSSSNVAENEYPLYQAATNYVATDKVIYNHVIYEALKDVVGVTPDSAVLSWLNIGATNQYVMFVGSVDKLTQNQNNINTVVSVTKIHDTISLIDVIAISVNIIVTDLNTNEVYNNTVVIDPTKTVNGRLGILTLSDLPLLSSSTINVIIDNGSNVAECGQLIIGASQQIGDAQYGAQVGIKDFSKKSTDQFGNVSITERGYADTAQYTVKINTADVYAVKQLLASLRAQSVLYIGADEHTELVIFGFLVSFNITVKNAKTSDCRLSLEDRVKYIIDADSRIDAQLRADAAEQSAITAAALDATAKANAAKSAAIATAATAAQAKADLAQTEAKAYADGIVTVEETRAIADATAKADTAEAAAILAASNDATAKANAAALFAEWSGLSNVPVSQIYNNLIDSSEWVVGSTGSQTGVETEWTQYGANIESSIVLEVGPYGSSEPLWKCTTDGSYDGSGGWQKLFTNGFDHTKTYRFTVWVKRVDSNDGRTYLGCNGSVLTLTGANISNPYFWNGDLPQLDKWYLIVGVLHGSGYAGSVSGLTGVYDPDTGKRVLGGIEFKSIVGTTQQKHRALYYYAVNINEVQYLARPRVDLMDGNEPTITSLLSSNAVLNSNTTAADIGYTGDLNATANQSDTITNSAIAQAEIDALATAAIDATAKANTAEATAISTAATASQAQANVAVVTSNAYADGIVTTEEARAISDAQAKADTAEAAAILAASNDATAKANTAALTADWDNIKNQANAPASNATKNLGGLADLDRVGTNEVAANAISVSGAYFSAVSVSLPVYSANTEIASITITTTGSPVFLTFTAEISTPSIFADTIKRGALNIKRNGTSVHATGFHGKYTINITATYLDVPPAGTHIYTLVASNVTNDISIAASVSGHLMELKR